MSFSGVSQHVQSSQIFMLQSGHSGQQSVQLGMSILQSMLLIILVENINSTVIVYISLLDSVKLKRTELELLKSNK